jgi:phosphopantothenate synthetase
MTINVPKSFPKYLELVKRQRVIKESKTIRVSKENYDKIVSERDMTKTFDQVLTKIMERAEMAAALDMQE